MIGSRLFNGALAGTLATAPMTVFMVAMHRLLPRHEQYPLPPSQVTATAEAKSGVQEHVDREQHVAVTLLSHFAYGAAAGAIFAPIAKALPIPAVWSGIGYGLVVWTISYLGLLPALGLLRPATEQPARRNALMIVAHIVWGSVTGLLLDRLERNR